MSSPVQTANDELLGRIRCGDREAVAEFIRAHEPLIRRRFRHKLGAAVRRVMDSEELVSTLSRRLDAYMAMGRLSATTQEQLWALVFRIAERSVFDKLRELQRSPSPAPASEWVSGEGQFEAVAGKALDQHTGKSVNEILRLIPEQDREIASGWVRGLDFNTMGELAGMSPEAVRQRWHRIKLELRDRYGQK